MAGCLCVIVALFSAPGVDGDESSSDAAVCRSERIASEVIRIGRSLDEFGPAETLRATEVVARDENTISVYPLDRIRASYGDRIEVDFHAATLEVLSIRRPAAAAQQRRDSHEQEALPTWRREQAESRARASVAAVLGNFPADVCHMRSVYKPIAPFGRAWEVVWVRTFGGYRTTDQILVVLSEGRGVLSLSRSFHTSVESAECRLTESQALLAAQGAAAATLGKFSRKQFSQWLQSFTIGARLTADQLGQLGLLLGLLIVHPEYPLRDSFRSLDDFAQAGAPVGRLAYGFAFQLIGPRFDDGTGIADKQLFIWIDAANGEVLKVVF